MRKPSRSAVKEARNEARRDNSPENRKRIKRGKKPMRQIIRNNRACWTAG